MAEEQETPNLAQLFQQRDRNLNYSAGELRRLQAGLEAQVEHWETALADVESTAEIARDYAAQLHQVRAELQGVITQAAESLENLASFRRAVTAAPAPAPEEEEEEED